MSRVQRNKRKPPAKRVRRSADEARNAILDATERRLVAHGPAGIRLQEVAADVGVSHPTVLHHFGSRELLVNEVISRRIRSMSQEVVLAMVGTDRSELEARELMARLFQVFGPGGHARVIAFLALEDWREGPAPENLKSLAQVVHAARKAHCAPDDQPSFEDTYFIVLLGALALFGEAIVGPMFRGEVDESDDETSRSFIRWVAVLLRRLLDRGGVAE